MEPDKPIEPAGNGSRSKFRYFGDNFYVVVTDQSFDISYSTERADKIEARTKVGFGIISRLATRLLEDGIDQEDLASIFFTENRSKLDLADILSKAIENEITRSMRI